MSLHFGVISILYSKLPHFQLDDNGGMADRTSEKEKEGNAACD